MEISDWVLNAPLVVKSFQQSSYTKNFRKLQKKHPVVVSWLSKVKDFCAAIFKTTVSGYAAMHVFMLFSLKHQIAHIRYFLRS